MNNYPGDLRWVSRIQRRSVLKLDPTTRIAIKRDVHQAEIDAPARAYSQAFERAMVDPANTYGYIRVIRAADRSGHPFILGERFQGRYDLSKALVDQLRASWLAPLAEPANLLLEFPGTRLFTHWLENRNMSDYGEIVQLDLYPQPGEPELFQMKYVYLEGTPFAGSTTFQVEPIGAESCRVIQTFVYQELDLAALLLVSGEGLKFHDQVVYQQFSRAAALIGAKITNCTIPGGYREVK